MLNFLLIVLVILVAPTILMFVIVMVLRIYDSLTLPKGYTKTVDHDTPGHVYAKDEQKQEVKTKTFCTVKD